MEKPPLPPSTYSIKRGLDLSRDFLDISWKFRRFFWGFCPVCVPLLSKTSHWDVFDGQPVRPPGTGPSGFSAPNGCPPFVTKRPAVPRPGCRPRCRAEGFQLSFFLSKRKLVKEKCALRKSISPVATGDRGASLPMVGNVTLEAPLGLPSPALRSATGQPPRLPQP